MGQAALDLPDPLDLKPSASAKGADDLLSEMAGNEIDRLLAQADLATESGVATATNAAAFADRRNEAGGTADTAVSAFVSRGDPVLEAELDNLLSNLAAAGQANEANKGPEKVGTAEASSAAHASDSALPVTAAASNEVASERALGGGNPAPTGNTDPVLEAELDQVFDNMTGRLPMVDAAMPGESLDLLKVLDPIVKQDAARAHLPMILGSPAHAAPSGEAASADRRSRIGERILDVIDWPMSWIAPEVRDVMGKLAILTLLNAIAVLIYVVLIRKK